MLTDLFETSEESENSTFWQFVLGLDSPPQQEARNRAKRSGTLLAGLAGACKCASERQPACHGGGKELGPVVGVHAMLEGKMCRGSSGRGREVKARGQLRGRGQAGRWGVGVTLRHPSFPLPPPARVSFIHPISAFSTGALCWSALTRRRPAIGRRDI